MDILYNGNRKTLKEPCTIGEFLKIIGKSQIPMMVKLNNNFVPEKDYNSIHINQGDSILVLLFLGGG